MEFGVLVSPRCNGAAESEAESYLSGTLGRTGSQRGYRSGCKPRDVDFRTIGAPTCALHMPGTP